MTNLVDAPNTEVRLLRKSDTSQVVQGWNACLMYDQINETTIESVLFGDPNYEKEGNLVAVREDEIVGFVAAVAREGVAGRDGKGTVEERDFGYIKGLFVLEECSGEGIKRSLLKHALEFLKSNGKKMVLVGEYTGRYFSPGIDTRYERELEFYRENGFEYLDDEEDVALDLRAFEPTTYQIQAKRRVDGLGVIIRSYHPNDLEKLRLFATKLDYVQWFPEGWESSFGKRGHTLVALLGEDIVGWAEFLPNPEEGLFGPIAVLQDFRRKGIGTCLLLESVIRMKSLRTPNVTAGWADVPFYVRNGWEVSRRYIVLQKEL